jgi:hypothetical protein
VAPGIPGRPMVVVARFRPVPQHLAEVRAADSQDNDLEGPVLILYGRPVSCFLYYA